MTGSPEQLDSSSVDPGRLYVLRVWPEPASDRSGWHASVRYGQTPPRHFHHPDDLLLYVYSECLRRLT